jgi:hypothetical protein
MVTQYTTLKSLGNYEPGKENSDQRELLDKIGQLQRIGNSLGLSAGIVLCMINRVYGFVWETIPNNRFDEMESLIKKGYKYWIKCTAPDLYWRYVSSIKRRSIADPSYDISIHDDIIPKDFSDEKSNCDPVKYAGKMMDLVDEVSITKEIERLKG